MRRKALPIGIYISCDLLNKRNILEGNLMQILIYRVQWLLGVILFSLSSPRRTALRWMRWSAIVGPFVHAAAVVSSISVSTVSALFKYVVAHLSVMICLFNIRNIREATKTIQQLPCSFNSMLPLPWRSIRPDWRLHSPLRSSGRE